MEISCQNLCNGENYKNVVNFLKALEDDDDVQNVYTNCEIKNSLIESI